MAYPGAQIRTRSVFLTVSPKVLGEVVVGSGQNKNLQWECDHWTKMRLRRDHAHRTLINPLPTAGGGSLKSKVIIGTSKNTILDKKWKSSVETKILRRVQWCFDKTAIRSWSWCTTMVLVHAWQCCQRFCEIL